MGGEMQPFTKFGDIQPKLKNVGKLGEIKPKFNRIPKVA